MNEQKDGLGALSAVWERRTPVQSQIEQICAEVHAAYAARRQGGGSSGGGGGGGGGSGKAIIGQKVYDVAQYKVLKKCPRDCQLGVGSMGLALFDGIRPVATWPFKLVESVAVSPNGLSESMHRMHGHSNHYLYDPLAFYR